MVKAPFKLTIVVFFGRVLRFSLLSICPKAD